MKKWRTISFKSLTNAVLQGETTLFLGRFFCVLQSLRRKVVCKLTKSLLTMALFITISLTLKVYRSSLWRINISLVYLLVHLVSVFQFEQCDYLAVGGVLLVIMPWPILQDDGADHCLESISLEQWQGWRKPNRERCFQKYIREPVSIPALSPSRLRHWPTTLSPWAAVSRLKLSEAKKVVRVQKIQEAATQSRPCTYIVLWTSAPQILHPRGLTCPISIQFVHISLIRAVRNLAVQSFLVPIFIPQPKAYACREPFKVRHNY